MRINIKKQRKRAAFSCLFGLLMVMIFVRYVLQIMFPWELLLVIVAMLALVGDQNEIIAMCLCGAPLYTSMQYIYAVVICLALYILKYGKELRINSHIMPVILLLLWEWLHSFDRYSSAVGAVRAMVPLLLCAFLMCCPRDKIDYAFVSRVFALCTSVMCLIVLSKIVIGAGFNLQLAFSNMQRFGMSGSATESLGADFNPNFLGFLCILGITAMFQLRLEKEGKLSDMVMAIFLMLCGLMTLSRTYLLCLVLMAMLLVVANGFSVKKLLKLSAGAVACGALLFLILLLFFPAVVEDWVGRFQVADITSGRLELMARYHERIFEHADIYMFGIGIQSVTDKVVARFGPSKILGTVVPHNSIQEMIFCWGIPGLLMFIVFLCSMVKSARQKNPEIRLLNYIPLILLLIKTQAGQLISTPANVMLLSLTYLSMCCKMNGGPNADRSGLRQGEESHAE